MQVFKSARAGSCVRDQVTFGNLVVRTDRPSRYVQIVRVVTPVTIRTGCRPRPEMAQLYKRIAVRRRLPGDPDDAVRDGEHSRAQWSGEIQSTVEVVPETL